MRLMVAMARVQVAVGPVMICPDCFAEHVETVEQMMGLGAHHGETGVVEPGSDV